MASRHTSMASNSSMARKPSTKPKPSDLQGYVIDRQRPAPKFLSENLLGEEVEDEVEPTPTSYEPLRPLQPQRHFSADGSGRLVIAIDYGTTFTGVAFAVPRSDTANLADIQYISDWGPAGNNAPKIPSVISYSPSSEQQWGANIIGEAVSMVNTKMELDVQDNKIDELELIIQLLHGTENLSFEAVKKARGLPEYTYKTPEEIATDYLTEVFKTVSQYLDDIGAGSGLKEKIQVDIVVTVPVKWSYRAKNSTLRAVRQAGFNNKTFSNLVDMILVTEPEAAALYTARHLKEEKKTEVLKLGECFVLCDSGGGTVDCVSYKVTQLEPTLSLEEMSVPTSSKCGSSFIDANFKWWLRSLLGKHYQVLDPRSSGLKSATSEGGSMRTLMKAFDIKKRAFASKPFSEPHADIQIDLPPGPLHRLHIPNRMGDGELTITHDEMRGFFDPCVDGVVELIQGQIGQVERTRNRVKNVFLVGGFAESVYLQDELAHSLELRKIKMHKPDKVNAWTAVVQGAVIYGIEKQTRSNLTLMTTCARSYGVALNEVYSPIKYDRKDQYLDPVTNCEMAQQQITWLIRKGDLILSDEKKETEKEFLFHFKDTDERKFSLPVYEYPDEDDDVPERFATGENELLKASVLNCDLSSVPLVDFDRFQNPKTRRTFYIAYLICKVTLSVECLEVAIHLKGKQICTTKIENVQNAGAARSSPDSFEDSYSTPHHTKSTGSQSSSSTASRTQKRIAARLESMRMSSSSSGFDDDLLSTPPSSAASTTRGRPEPVILSKIDLVSGPDPLPASLSIPPRPRSRSERERERDSEIGFRPRSRDERSLTPEPFSSDFRAKRREKEAEKEQEKDITPSPPSSWKPRNRHSPSLSQPQTEYRPFGSTSSASIKRELTPEPPLIPFKTEEPAAAVKRKNTTLGRFSVPDFYASGAYVAELPGDETMPRVPGGYGFYD